MEEKIGDSLAGKILRVATIEDMPISGTVKVNNTLEGAGMIFEILDLLEKTLNFTYTVVPSANPIESAYKGEIDFVAALMPIPRHPDSLKYSTPIAADKWVFLMKRPSKSLVGSSLLAPFTLEVWMLTFFALVLMGPLIFSIIKLRHKLIPPTTKGSKSRMYQLNECVWFTYGAIMKQGSPLDPTDDTTRLLFATWWIFITILTSYYTANLTAFLTLSRFSFPISHPEELAEKNVKWFGRSGGALEQAISGDDDEMQYLKDSLDSGQGQLLECTNEEIVDLVMKNVIYLGELRKIQALLYENYVRNIEKFDDAINRCQMVNTLDPFLIRPMALAFPENSSLPALFNPVLLAMVEGGVIGHILNSKASQSEICPLNLGNTEKQLKLTDFTSTYLAVVFGFIIAMFSFFSEKITNRFFKRKSKTKVGTKAAKEALYPNEFLQIQDGNTPVLLDPKLFILNRVAGKSKVQFKQPVSVHFHYLD